MRNTHNGTLILNTGDNNLEFSNKNSKQFKFDKTIT